MIFSSDVSEISTTSSLMHNSDDDDNSSTSSGSSSSSLLDDLFFSQSQSADDDESCSNDSNAEIIIRVNTNINTNATTEPFQPQLQHINRDDCSSMSSSASSSSDPSSKRIIASLRKELRKLRETTDDEYAVAVAMAARDRENFQKQLAQMAKERDDALENNKLQQMHINVLTEEVIRWQDRTQQARDETQRHQQELSMARSQLDQLRDGMDKFRKSFEDWLASTNTAKKDSETTTTPTPVPTTSGSYSEAPTRSKTSSPSIPILTGTSPTGPMEELEKAYCELSGIVNVTGIPRSQRDACSRRSWPEPPNPIKLPFLSSSMESSTRSVPTTTTSASTVTATTAASSSNNSSHLDRPQRRTSRDSVRSRPGTASTKNSTTKPKKSRSHEANSDALLQADFIKAAVQKQRRSTWSNLSLLLRDPAEELLQEGNLMGQVVEFRVDSI